MAKPEIREWVLCKPLRGKPPTSRYGHTAVVYKNKMYIFGGNHSDTTSGFVFDSEIYVYSFLSESWERLRPKTTTTIIGRYCHSAVVYKNGMYIVGGYEGVKHMIRYDFDTNTWSAVNTRGMKVSTFNSAVLVFDHKMYHIGGRDVPRLFVFDFKTNTWSISNFFGEFHTVVESHTAILYKDSAYVFAGYTTSGRTNQLYKIDLKTLKCLEVKTKNPPSPRHFHTSVVSGDSMWVFGGSEEMDHMDQKNSFLYELNLKTFEWKTYELTNMPPRYWHTSVVHDGWMYVFGGQDNRYGTRCNSLYKIRLGDRKDIIKEKLMKLIRKQSFVDVCFVVDEI